MSKLHDEKTKQRLKRQEESLESPSALPMRRFSRASFESGASPMTDLATNLGGSYLETPSPTIDTTRRKLALVPSSKNSTPTDTLDSSSNDSTAPMTNTEDDITPVSTVPTNTVPSRKKLGFGGCLESSNEPSFRRRKHAFSNIFNMQPLSPTEPGLKELSSDDLEEESHDSGFDSQYFGCEQEDGHTWNNGKANIPEDSDSEEEMLVDRFPDKEQGFAALPRPFTALPRSPEGQLDEAKEYSSLAVGSLTTVREEEEPGTEDAPSELTPCSVSSLLGNSLIHSSPKEKFESFLSSKSTSTAASHSPAVSFRRSSSLMSKRLSPPSDDTPAISGKKQKMEKCNSSLESSETTGRGLSGQQIPTLHRSQSAAQLKIMESLERREETPDCLPDNSGGRFLLPSISGESKNPQMPSISCHTLADVLEGRYASKIKSCKIVDVRYRYEYEGGHIEGAENWPHDEEADFLSSFLPTFPLTSAPDPDQETNSAAAGGRDILIFHCEFSSKRGPDFCSKLRSHDRTLNSAVYPALYFPECYILHLGYKEFWSKYPNLCTGSYILMTDPKHQKECKKMMAKSKSFSGGTVSRIAGAKLRKGGSINKVVSSTDLKQ